MKNVCAIRLTVLFLKSVLPFTNGTPLPVNAFAHQSKIVNAGQHGMKKHVNVKINALHQRSGM